MPDTPPTIGRARLHPAAGCLRITIPAQRRWDVIVGKPLLLIFMLCGVVVIFKDSIVVAVALSVIGVAMVARQALWSLLGEETITVHKHALAIRYDLAGIRWQHNYSLERIYHLRFVRWTTVHQLQDGEDAAHIGFVGFDYDGHAMRSEQVFGLLTSLFHYDYDPQRPRFGRGLTEAEVQNLIKIIESYAGVTLSSDRLPPAHLAPGGILADETIHGWGVAYGMAVGTWIFCYLGSLAHYPAGRYSAFAGGFLSLMIGVMSMAGYRYRCRRGGIEISIFALRVAWIPAEHVSHWEPSTRRLADACRVGIYGKRRACGWTSKGVRLRTMDGEFFLGHPKPAVLVRDLDLIKQMANQTSTKRMAAEA